jgi:hypothetical protein
LVNGITKDIESTFGKYEDENPFCSSVFEELLSKKKQGDKPSTISEE